MNGSEFNLTDASYPPLPTCSNAELTDLMPTIMESMEHNKEIVLKNRTKKCKDGIQEKVRVSMTCTVNGTDEVMTEDTCENATTEAVTELAAACELKSGKADKINFNTSDPLLQYVGGKTVEYDSKELTTGQEIDIICK